MLIDLPYFPLVSNEKKKENENEKHVHNDDWYYTLKAMNEHIPWGKKNVKEHKKCTRGKSMQKIDKQKKKIYGGPRILQSK